MHQDQTFQLAKAYTRASDRMNANTYAFNNQPKYRGKNLLHSPKLLAEYNDDYAQLFTKVLNEELDKAELRHGSTRPIVVHTSVNGMSIWKVVVDE